MDIWCPLTPEAAVRALSKDSRENAARKKFSSWCAKIEQAGQQRTPLSAPEMRQMEFEAVQEIILAFHLHGGEPYEDNE